MLCSFALASVGSAFAADLPSAKEAPLYTAATPAFSWSGFYVGADIGGASGSSSVDNFGAAQETNATSLLGGGYAGYNVQVSSNFVLGVEGDIQRTASSTTFTTVQTNNPFFSYYGQLKNQQNWLGAINGRIGVSYDRALFYAVGGGAWLQDNVTSNYALTGAGAFARSTFNSVSQNVDVFGFDVGGGVEYAINPNWLGRVEYRYYGFGSYTPQQGFGGAERTSVNTVRVGLAYLFNAPSPVVAKY